MTVTPADTQLSSLDMRLLSSLVIEMNILRRHVTAYPAGHPIISSAAEKVVGIVLGLLERSDRITLGIARDTLMLDDHPLSRKNPVYRDFARALFDRGGISLTITRELGSGELIRFSEILGWSEEMVREQGGIELALAAAGVRHLQVREIDYDYFLVTEEERMAAPDSSGATDSSPGIWEQFVRGLKDGTLDPFGEATEKSLQMEPKELARIMNSQLLHKNAERHQSYEAVITSFLRRMGSKGSGRGAGKEQSEKLARMVQLLHPELRRQFMGRTFAALANHPETMQKLLPELSDDAILEALDELNNTNATIPPVILGLCEKLGADGRGELRGISPTTLTGAGEKLATFLREGDSARYVPDPYQAKLQKIAAAGTLADTGLPEAFALRMEILGQNIEAKFGAIIIEILKEARHDDDTGGVGENLAELCDYYLEAGDFAALQSLCDRLAVTGASTPTPRLQREVMSIITSPSFVDGLLAAPALWGKERFPEIRSLISRIGWPCIAPLMELLADEQSMSLRRLYIECLTGLGNMARDAAIAHLDDDRWYFVRNLIIILREFGDSIAAEPLRRLLHHSHPKVRQEVLRTLLHFRDPDAERKLLNDLQSDDLATFASALNLTDASVAPRIFERLLARLRSGGTTPPELEIKRAIIRTLAETGNCDAIPELARILRSKRLLRSATLDRFKVEIVRALGRFPETRVISLLRETAASANDVIASAAQETLRKLQARER